MVNQSQSLWLKIASGITIASGLAFAAAAHQAFAGSALEFLALVGAGQDGDMTTAQRLLSAISGGVLTGFGMMIWAITTRLVPRDPALARQLILTGILSWFIVDSTGSVIAGAAMNVVPNIGFLLLFAVPAVTLVQVPAADAH